MRGKNPNTPSTTEAIVPRAPQQSPMAPFYISITIAQPKIRIKVPKLLAKSVGKKFHGSNDTSRCDDDQNDQSKKEKSKKTKAKKIISEKFGSIFSNLFCHRKSPETAIKNITTSKISDSDGDRDDSTTESEIGSEIFEKLESEGFDFGDPPLKSSTDFSSEREFSLNEKKRVGENDDNSQFSGTSLSSSDGLVVFGRRENAVHFIRATSKLLKARRKLITVSLLRKVKKFEKNPEEEGKEEELCKKRILMGEKCKPLSFSGTLHYDKNGFLLPDELP